MFSEKNKKYLANEESKIRDEWKMASGEEDWQNSDSWGFSGSEDEFKKERTSLPFIIQISNPLNDPSNTGTFVDVGDSLSNRTGNNGTFTNGSYTPNDNPGITISFLVSGITYLDFLGQSENQPFKVGKTLIIVTAGGAAAQFAQGVTLTHREAGGVRHDEPIVGVIDPYQNQTDRYLYEGEYLFDGFTRLRFNQINAHTTIVIYFYPEDKFSATQEVAGRKSKIGYGEPIVTRVEPINNAEIT